MDLRRVRKLAGIAEGTSPLTRIITDLRAEAERLRSKARELFTMARQQDARPLTNAEKQLVANADKHAKTIERAIDLLSSI